MSTTETERRQRARVLAQLVQVCPVPHATFTDTFGAPRVGHLHQGQDLMAPLGAPIFVSHSGLAVDASGGLGGVAVEVRSRHGHTYYAHLRSILGQMPRAVVAGEQVGYVDHTGNAAHSANHCHYEVWPRPIPAGLPISPYGYSVIGGAVDSFRDLSIVCSQQRRKPLLVSNGLALALAYYVGLRPPGLLIAVAVMDAESGGHEDARNVNVNGSIDRGLWQINNRAHPGVSGECAYNGLCNAHSMSHISSRGRDWSAWTTFERGTYLQYMRAVRDAYANTDWRSKVSAIPSIFAGGPGGIGPPPPVPAPLSVKAMTKGERWAPLVRDVADRLGWMGVAGHRRARLLRSMRRSWHRRSYAPPGAPAGSSGLDRAVPDDAAAEEVPRRYGAPKDE